MRDDNQRSSPKLIDRCADSPIHLQLSSPVPPNHSQTNRARLVRPRSIHPPPFGPMLGKFPICARTEGAHSPENGYRFEKRCFSLTIRPRQQNTRTKIFQFKRGMAAKRGESKMPKHAGGSGRPHRHDHVKKRFVIADHAGAELIDKIKVNAVVLNIL